MDFIIIILLLNQQHRSKWEKHSCLEIAFATSQARAPQKTEENTTKGSNQRMTAPSNSSSFPV